MTQRQITSFFKRPELNAGPRAESIQVSEDPGGKVQQSYFDDQNTELDDVGGNDIDYQKPVLVENMTPELEVMVEIECGVDQTSLITTPSSDLVEKCVMKSN